jgi:hypothetical protein
VSEASSAASVDVHGPVDYLIMEFPTDQLTGEMVPRLAELMESGIIRLYDLMIISKGDDGAVEAVALQDSPVAQDFTYFAGASSGLLNDEDMQQAADAMNPGTVAALLVYENTWAVPFVAAARRSSGEVIASGRIPATVVMEALDALDGLQPATT